MFSAVVEIQTTFVKQAGLDASVTTGVQSFCGLVVHDLKQKKGVCDACASPDKVEARRMGHYLTDRYIVINDHLSDRLGGQL